MIALLKNVPVLRATFWQTHQHVFQIGHAQFIRGGGGVVGRSGRSGSGGGGGRGGRGGRGGSGGGGGGGGGGGTIGLGQNVLQDNSGVDHKGPDWVGFDKNGQP